MPGGISSAMAGGFTAIVHVLLGRQIIIETTLGAMTGRIPCVYGQALSASVHGDWPS